MPYLCKECLNLRFACLDIALEGTGLAATPAIECLVHGLSQLSGIGGFADDFANYALTLDFPCELMSKLDEKEKEVLADILAGDPRPSYQNDKDRIYTLDHGRWKVSFSVDGDTLHVRDVVENENGGDEIYEYMRMYR